ncbi:EAL domain-containing protein [Methylophaga sp.]|uniref:EAL domain-containing protein n=1 Tax=Methylophaga sp. TaxID=2024840 RepID=UPI003F69565E
MGLTKALFANVILTLAYFASGQLVGLLSLPPVDATPLWVPAGIAVTAVLIWGYRLLPGAFLGDFLIGLQLNGWTDLNGLSLAFLWGLQSLLLAAIARWILVRFIDWPNSLVKESHILKFFLITAVIAPLIPTGLIIGGQLLLDELTSLSVANSFLIWWLGTAMGIVIVSPIMLSLFAHPRSSWRPRVITVSIPMIVLLALFLVMLDAARDRENDLNQTRFNASAGLVNSLIENEVAFHRSVLKSSQAYFQNSVDVTKEEFDHFLRDAVDQQQDIEIVAWLEFVPKGEQFEFEDENDIAIRQYDEANQLLVYKTSNAPSLVVKYLETEQSSMFNNMLGLDICTNAHRRLCRLNDIEPESAYFVNLSQLIPNVDTSDQLVHLMPVMNKTGNLRGYVMQMLHYQSLFSQIYYDKASSWVEFDVTSLQTGEVLFESQPDQDRKPFMTGESFETSHVINHGNDWRIDYYPSRLFFETYASWSFYWVVTLVLFFFSLISVWLLTLSGRYRVIEEEVRNKTQELNEHSELLASNEEKYRRLVENLQDEYFLYSHDLKGVFSYVSPSLELILGYSQEEFLQHYTTFLSDSEVNQMVPRFTEHTVAGNKSNYELEIIDKQGELHTLAVTEVPSYNENKEVIGVEGIARDITRFKASQLRLEKLSLAVEHSPNAIVVMDKEGQVEYVNPKFTDITGYSNDEKLGRWPDMINSAVNMPGIYEEIWRTIRKGENWRGELQYRKKNGDLYWAQELIAPMLNAEGQATHFVVTQVDITEARRLSEETSYQASHDQLTGLINRHEFDLRLDRVILAAQHNLTEHALCFLDLDQFKLVNDTCGHIAGDELLRQVGGLLQNNVRSRDTIARLGGDEFAILMEHCTIDKAFKACGQILQLLADFRFHWEDYTFTVGVSIGLAIIDQHTSDGNEALRNVDTACYSAKDAGRNRVEVHREDSVRLQERRGEIQWSTEISEALDDDRFVLYAQPIKPLKTPESGMSYEVLVRMIRKDGQISPPGAFLPAAERYNSIGRIDRWVISHTFSWLHANANRLNNVATISINLSGLSMGDESMLQFIIDELARAKIAGKKIKFEITETAAIANLRAATKFIDTLGESGIRFSLDDFGSGLSSFAYLKKMKVDSLKIDGMFVKDMLTDPLDYEMVKSINEIGHVMGLHTIAEFVENDAILAKLSEIGVDFVQGYAIGKPEPIDTILTTSNNY